MEQPDSQDSEVIESPESAENTAADVEDDDIDGEAELENESTDDPDDEEIEYEGEKFKVPAKLKDAFLRQADYTRKTQEAAEIKRQAETQVEAVKQREAFIQQNVAEVARIHAIDAELMQFQNVNWDQLWDSDPVQAGKLNQRAQMLQAQRAQTEQVLTQRQAQFQQWQQQQAAMRMQEGQRVLQREIPNWGTEVQSQLLDYAQKTGWSASEIQNITPRQVVALYRDLQFTKIREKATQKPKVVQEKPVTRIAATKATANKDPDKMSTEEWAKWRQAQLKKR